MIGFSSAQRVCERDKETDRETDGETKLSRMSHCDMSWLMMNYSRLYNHLIHEGKPSSVGCVYCPNYAENFLQNERQFWTTVRTVHCKKSAILKGIPYSVTSSLFRSVYALACAHNSANYTKLHKLHNTLNAFPSLCSGGYTGLHCEKCVCVICSWDCKWNLN